MHPHGSLRNRCALPMVNGSIPRPRRRRFHPSGNPYATPPRHPKRCLFPLKIRAAARRAPATAAGPSEAASAGTEKFFKSDPRIDLQALVWSPESTARFVVINNRLIKEGGSIDDIVVVRINRDDVLLAEGSDRWHEVFKIR
jgi:hypothetical protein